MQDSPARLFMSAVLRSENTVARPQQRFHQESGLSRRVVATDKLVADQPQDECWRLCQRRLSNLNAKSTTSKLPLVGAKGVCEGAIDVARDTSISLRM